MAQSTHQPQTQQPSLTQIPVLNSQSKYALVVRGTTIYISEEERVGILKDPLKCGDKDLAALVHYYWNNKYHNRNAFVYAHKKMETLYKQRGSANLNDAYDAALDDMDDDDIERCTYK